MVLVWHCEFFPRYIIVNQKRSNTIFSLLLLCSFWSQLYFCFNVVNLGDENEGVILVFLSLVYFIIGITYSLVFIPSHFNSYTKKRKLIYYNDVHSGWSIPSSGSRPRSHVSKKRWRWVRGQRPTCTKAMTTPRWPPQDSTTTSNRRKNRLVNKGCDENFIS